MYTVTTTSMPTDPLISDSTTTTLNMIVTSIYTTQNANNLYTNLDGFYVLAGLGAGILVFTFCIIAVCICLCLQLARRKRQLLTLTAENVYTMDDGEQPQQQQMHGM